ncbi:MAG: hypothetical protein ACXAE3_10045 [Candidatus Kariarchaeaceae archaeon]|jgi:hypothetical protein
MDFKLFVEKRGSTPEPLEVMGEHLAAILGDQITVTTLDVSKDKDRKEASKLGVEETPSLLFEKVRISGQVNEYFLLACVAQLLTTDGNDQSGSTVDIEGDDAEIKLKVASGFLAHQTQIREEINTYLLMIRSSTDDFNPELLLEMANSGTTIFMLTNFEEGSKREELAAIGSHERILIGHIMRTNIHMTMSITVRKGRPFFGSYVRAKDAKTSWTGKWSPLLHDTVSELKDFFVPLFNTSSPVQLDGVIPEPLEVNRLVAKVKDNIEILRALFF